jgi:hypothetical protein
VGCIFDYVWRGSCHCYYRRNLYVVGGQVRVTVEFDNIDDAKKAIHANEAWTALVEISEAMRSHTKHDVPEKQTLISIEETLSDVRHMLYS